MLALLLLLSFNFDSILSPQLAGDSFYISIFSSDSSELCCSLWVTSALHRLEVCGTDDNKINFTDGRWSGWVRIPNIADSISLCCFDSKSKEYSLSNKFTVTDEVNLSQLRQVATSDSIYIYPNPLSIEYNFTSINYDLREDAHVSIMIFDKFGNLVWNTEIDQSPGTQNVEWDGTDNNNNSVFSGVYIVFIKATNRTATIAKYAGKIAVIK